ncbi:MAG: LON peptidase substrate-binding domain-containing protein, partial [Spirochaetota bacterium]
MLANLPIFPLPELLLFPGTFLPLHIFETRYRLLLDYSTESDYEIGITCYESQDSITETIGWGKIIKIEPLVDGRSNILIQGHGIAKIADYSSKDPFIIAKVEKLEADLNHLNQLAFQDILRSILELAKDFLGKAGVEPVFISELDKLRYHSFPIEFISSILNIDFQLKKELFLQADPLAKA